MRNRILIFVILLVLITGGLTFIYYKYEKTNGILNLEYTNLSISAMLENEKIVIGYILKRDGFFHSEGKTLEGGAVLVKVPINSTYEISSVNLENQTYYTVTKSIIVKELKPYRADLEIVPPGNISISHFLNKTNEMIILNIKSKGPYNRLIYCIDWSNNFLWVNSLKNIISKIEIPKYVKCYETNISLDDNEYNITLEYKEWESLVSEDYVKIFIFDTKIVNNETIYNDFGGGDISYNVSGF